MDERTTRKQVIDPRLRAAGWEVTPYLPGAPVREYSRCAVEEYPTEAGPADYALCLDGRVVGIVEAKKVALGPQNVLTQAARYSQGVTESDLAFAGFRVPFLYSTNGEVIWFQDVRPTLSRSRRVARFHTPDALLELLNRDAGAVCERLRQFPNDHPRLRPYQREANDGIEEAIVQGRRRMLVAMATGTGKTFTLVNQAYRLMKADVARRILFLVDRRALAAQAVRAFASFEPEPGLKFNQIYEVYSQRFRREEWEEDEKFDPKVLPAGHLLAPQPGHAFVYICTIQRMTLNLFGREGMMQAAEDEEYDDAERLDIPIHAFDVVVADECHRGYTARETAIWRQTLDHFDAVKIGLTATPALHTVAYFEHMAYRYEYARAVQEGFLVDYDAVAVKSGAKLKGIKLPEGAQVDVVDRETGFRQMDFLEDERAFKDTDVERRVTSPDANRKILQEVYKYAQEHDKEFGRLPKTLIFAANDLEHVSHADQVVNVARDIFGLGDAFVQKITGKVDRPLQRIREFRNRDMPGVAVTVDLLSTGVDIPDLEFIVLMRRVQSRILFEQMLGRGTRLGDRFADKSHFVVFDCFDGSLIDYFRGLTDITTDPPEKAVRPIAEVVADIWDNRDRDYNIRILTRRLQRVAREMSGEARELFAAVGVPAGDVARFARELEGRLRDDFAGTISLLRDASFQDLVVNYPRPREPFTIAMGYTDDVSSAPMPGRYKPEDYLAAFARFVRENPEHVEAIAILLERPREWGTDALAELRNKLAAATERFTEKNLRLAHLYQYKKALVDIISMVKHAAREEEALLTARERVAFAFERVTANREFTPEQWLWLDRVRRHLEANLSIGRDDFGQQPAFADHGGWKAAQRVFDDQLEEIIREFNEAVAV